MGLRRRPAALHDGGNAPEFVTDDTIPLADDGGFPARDIVAENDRFEIADQLVIGGAVLGGGGGCGQHDRDGETERFHFPSTPSPGPTSPRSTATALISA